MLNSCSSVGEDNEEEVDEDKAFDVDGSTSAAITVPAKRDNETPTAPIAFSIVDCIDLVGVVDGHGSNIDFASVDSMLTERHMVILDHFEVTVDGVVAVRQGAKSREKANTSSCCIMIGNYVKERCGIVNFSWSSRRVTDELSKK